MKKINLFYEEPDHDRWIKYDKYLRRVSRRIIRSNPKIGGQKRVFLNLCKGLDELNISYRINDYKYIKNNPQEIACIIGKPFVLEKMQWKNPILFGASVFSHPTDDLNLFERLPVKKVLVPGEWMKKMWQKYYNSELVISWPTGIDTKKWSSYKDEAKSYDVLIYDKILWDYKINENDILKPIINFINQKKLKLKIIRYGCYKEYQYNELLKKSRLMIFLCEHETQGIAYQEALSCDVPIFAWDCGGYWKDPNYFPDKVKFKPVTSVPYWDNRCGMKFSGLNEFKENFDEFFHKVNINYFSPRQYIIDNLTLEKCAKKYIDIVNEIDFNN